MITIRKGPERELVLCEGKNIPEVQVEKECRKCLKRYDDTWRVCLFCGSELERTEKCRDVCAVEGSDPLEEVNVKKGIRALVFVFFMIVFVLTVIYLAFSAGTDFWNEVAEKFFTR